MYIDDGKINVAKENIKRHLDTTLNTLKEAGFIVVEHKTDSLKSASHKK